MRLETTMRDTVTKQSGAVCLLAYFSYVMRHKIAHAQRVAKLIAFGFACHLSHELLMYDMPQR